MKHELSPTEVEVMLRFWYDPEPGKYRWNPVQINFIEELINRGILERIEVDIIPVEDALRAYVEAICAIPLPKQVWVTTA